MFKKFCCVALALALTVGPHSIADACNLLSGIRARVAARQSARAAAYGYAVVRSSYGSSGATSYGSSGAASYGSSGGTASYGSSGGVTYSSPVVVYETTEVTEAPVVYEQSQNVRRTPVRNTLQRVFSPKTSRCADGKCSSVDTQCPCGENCECVDCKCNEKPVESIVGTQAPITGECTCGTECNCIDCDCPTVKSSVAGILAPVVKEYSVAGKPAPIVGNPILVASL